MFLKTASRTPCGRLIPWRAFSLAMRLRAEGQEQEKIIAKFEDAPAQLRQANRDSDEDIIMDVMDCLVGWCSPQMRIPAEFNET